jgi:hypothetical protein
VRARVLLLLAVLPLAAGCGIASPDSELPDGAVVDARDVLLTGVDTALLEGAQALDETEPFASSVDDYLARRAADLQPIEPTACGDAVVDLVLLGRDPGADGTVYTAPGIRLENGFGLVQTGREFPSADEAEEWFAAYRAALEGCDAFTVTTPDGEVEVTQEVADADLDVDGFVVRLEVTAPDDTTTYNEQWMLHDGPFALLVSSASNSAGDDALLPAVDLLHERLVAAVNAAVDAVGGDGETAAP